MDKVIILSFHDLDNLLAYIEKTSNFPIIDIDALLEVVIDKFINEINTDVNTYTNEIMKSNILNDRMEMDTNDFVNLNTLICELLTSVKNKLCELKMSGKDYFKYGYLKRRSGNIVLLKCKTGLHSTC